MAAVSTKSADACERALCTIKHHAQRREGNLDKRHMLPVPLAEITRIASIPIVLTIYTVLHDYKY